MARNMTRRIFIAAIAVTLAVASGKAIDDVVRPVDGSCAKMHKTCGGAYSYECCDKKAVCTKKPDGKSSSCELPVVKTAPVMKEKPVMTAAPTKGYKKPVETAAPVASYPKKPVETAAPVSTYPEKPVSDTSPVVHSKCYKEGERCMGAFKFPYVKYYPCCHGYSCTGKAYGYGKKCVKSSVAAKKDYGYKKPMQTAAPISKGYPAQKKCYKLGERCIGAKGFPFVKYYPCCDHRASCSGKDSHYGLVCAIASKKHYGYKKPVETAAPVSKGYPMEKKCYKIGERCIGAKGFPFVKYYPCCDHRASCSGKDSHYGLVCEIATKKHYGYKKPVQTAAPVAKKDYGYKKPVQTAAPVAKKDYGYKKPVQTAAPVAKKDYGYKKPVQTAAPVAKKGHGYGHQHHGEHHEHAAGHHDNSYKCYKEGERCRGSFGHPHVHYKPCCHGLVCSGMASGYGKKCVKPGYGKKSNEHNKGKKPSPVVVSDSKPTPAASPAPTKTDDINIPSELSDDDFEEDWGSEAEDEGDMSSK